MFTSVREKASGKNNPEEVRREERKQSKQLSCLPSYQPLTIYGLGDFLS